jgi:hypothetical protein
VSAVKATSRARELQCRNAAAIRWDHPNKDEIAREYAEQRLVEFVTKVVATAPPLTDEQRERISALLRAGGGLG